MTGQRLVDVQRQERRAAKRARRVVRMNGHKVGPRCIVDYKPPHPLCDNCGQPGPHFAPPSFGEPGFFTCVRNVEVSA